MRGLNFIIVWEMQMALSHIRDNQYYDVVYSTTTDAAFSATLLLKYS